MANKVFMLPVLQLLLPSCIAISTICCQLLPASFEAAAMIFVADTTDGPSETVSSWIFLAERGNHTSMSTHWAPAGPVLHSAQAVHCHVICTFGVCYLPLTEILEAGARFVQFLKVAFHFHHHGQQGCLPSDQEAQGGATPASSFHLMMWSKNRKTWFKLFWRKIWFDTIVHF